MNNTLKDNDFAIRDYSGEIKNNKGLDGGGEPSGATGGKTELVAIRAVLTVRRNTEAVAAEREWLTLLINNLDGLIREPSPEFTLAFAKNVQRYEQRRAAASQ